MGQPQVAYYETITRPARAEGRLVKQTGGHGQFAVVELEVEPLPAGSGFVFENKVVGGAVPRQFISAVEAGVREAMARGVLAEQPVVDIKVTLVDGKAHDVDSSERAFHTAASMAVRKAVAQASPILLEPIMRVEVVTPDEYLGEVIGDLSARSASITGHRAAQRQRPDRSRPTCRWPPCLAMPPRCARAPRAAAPLSWSSITMPRSRSRRCQAREKP